MIRLFSSPQILSKTYGSIIQSINNLEDELQILPDTQIKEEFNKLTDKYKKDKLRKHKLIDFLAQKNKKLTNHEIINSFALTREVSKRVLNLRHYDVQLLGGLILNEGKIIEMQTGEGKTLVATLPAITNTLRNEGVHIITVNDYLAKRDTEWIGQIYRFLDLSVGLINENFSNLQKRNNYNSDITYLTNTILGFDFLRDNLATETDEVVQRPFNFCIIDEVDSVLIDEAKTPLIISKPEETNIKKFFKAAQVINFLQIPQDFEIDERTNNVSLTERGFLKVKSLLKVKDLYNIKKKSRNDENFLEKKNDYAWIYYILNALKAEYLFFKNIHYVLQDNEIIIVDESTGRLMPGRKWGEGLHEAIEIKEGLLDLKGSQNISSINYQTLFRLYPKLSGMTGTAKTDELEFKETYNLSVVVIPTFKPVKRIDLPDLIYIDEKTKWNAVCQDVIKLKKIGRPVLIGTPTIESSDSLSNLFKRYHIEHRLLNARPENLFRESEIIAQAGKLKSVTIATNMAGRGTDILLGGNSEYQVKIQIAWILFFLLRRDAWNKKLNSKKNSFFANLLLELQNNYLLQVLKFYTNFELYFEFLIGPYQKVKKFDRLMLIVYQSLIKKRKKKCQKEANIIRKLGGLYVIGTQRHDSRRIDNQLRGRAGRQGDPGTSRFYLSVNDKLIRVFGGSQINKMLKLFKLKDKPFENKIFSKLVSSSQQKVESMYYEQRQNTNKYDEHLEKQHFFILELRKRVLYATDFYYFTNSLIEELIDDLIKCIENINTTNNNKNTKKLFAIPPQFYVLLNILNLTIYPFYPTVKNIKNLRNFLCQQSLLVYNRKEAEFWTCDENLFSEFQKLSFLSYIDFYWAEHLETMNFIKESIGWEAYAQKDPLLRYLEKSEYLFNIKVKNIRDFSLIDIFSSEITDS